MDARAYLGRSRLVQVPRSTSNVGHHLSKVDTDLETARIATSRMESLAADREMELVGR